MLEILTQKLVRNGWPHRLVLAAILTAGPSLASAQGFILYSPPDLGARAVGRVTLTSQATGGSSQDVTGTAWVAYRFTLVGTALQEVSISVKRDAGASAGSLGAFLYTDSAGVPGTNISDEGTGLPGLLFQSDIGTSFQTKYFRLPASGLTNGGNYWVVFQGLSITGGNFTLEARSSGSNLMATAADSSGSPGSWTGQAKEAVLGIFSTAGVGQSGESDNYRGIEGISVSGLGGFFSSMTGPGLKGESVNNFGIGGSSTNGIGVRATSVNNIAFVGISTGSAGGQFQTTNAGSPGVQSVSTSGPAIQTFSSGGSYQQDLGPNGSARLIVSTTEEITLSTSGSVTDSSTNLLIGDSLVLAVTYNITQTIVGPTDMQIGDATTAQRFLASHSPLGMTTGVGGVALDHQLGTAARFPGQKGASTLRITLNGTPSAGKVRVVVWSIQFYKPSS